VNSRHSTLESKTSENVAAQTGWRRLAAYISALVLSPLLVLWRQDNIMFSHAGYIDPWFYVGYAKNLVEFKRDYMPGHYTGSRLAWILPYFAVHSLLPPVAAAYVLHLSVWMLAVVSLFFTLNWLAGARAAFLTAFLMGMHSWFWYSTGWDYPDGAAIACVLLATALFTCAARSPVPRVVLLLAGAASAAALHCTLGWVGLSPLFPLPYVVFARVWRRRVAWRSVLDVVLWSGGGAILLTAVLGFVNLQLDGNFWFFLPSFDQGRSLASQSLPWIAGVWSGNSLSPTLWLPAAAACIAVFVLIRRMTGRGGTAANLPIVFAIQCLVTLAFLSYFQRTEAHGLSYTYYVSDMMPFAFLLIGTSFWRNFDRLSTSAWLAICGLAVAIFGFFWYDYGGAILTARSSGALYAAIAGGLLIGGLCVSRPRVAGPLALAGFALLAMESRFAENLPPHAARRTYSDIMQARARLELLRKGRDIRFWFDKNDPGYYSFLSFASTYIQASSYANAVFPEFPCGTVSQFKIRALVALSSRPGALETAKRSIGNCATGAGVKVLDAEPLGSIQCDAVSSAATFLLVGPDPAIWRPMMLATDASGASSLVPAESSDPPQLPFTGWHSQTPDSWFRQTARDLLVRAPSDNFGVTFLYSPLKITAAGRYSFSFEFQLRSSIIVVGVRDPGSLSWKGNAASENPMIDQLVVTADLEPGEVIELAFSSIKTGSGRLTPSLSLRSVTVLRSDSRL